MAPLVHLASTQSVMTERARLVLSDAKGAAEELPFGFSDTADASTIRRRYVAVMALLRAVGNVLNDFDGKRGPAHLQKAIAEQWLQPKPPIWDFIDGNRAAVLKRYEHPELDFDMIGGSDYADLYVDYGGADEVSVNRLVEAALRFWEDHLDAVDRLAEKYRQCADD